MVKSPPAMKKTWVRSLGQEDLCRRKWQLACLKSSIDRGARRATVDGVAKNHNLATEQQQLYPWAPEGCAFG